MMTRRDALAVPLAALLPGNLALAADPADPTKVFTGDKKPTDVRLGPPKTLNDYFPFTVPGTKEEWAARRAQLREQILVANGLWPLPDKTPLNAVIHGKIERDGYTIEKVYFASMPGHYVSGNLYRPAAGDVKNPKFPAVLSPHGHWTNGRFQEATDKEVEAQLKMGAEQTREGAKYPVQARHAALARMGFVAFHYDMVGYADSKALTHREGFKDAAAELRLQSFMGLQTWNTIRALDFLEALPDVDPKRIGVTGASGGGTQTFILCAIDDRPAAAVPAVMVGTAMQGGCVCENASLLRVGTGNVEIAAMFAPKPLALTGANDWTKEIMTKGFPELRALYKLLGSEFNVSAKAWVEFPHNYNQVAREFMYSWFAEHLQNKPGAVKEAPFKPVPPAELGVYDDKHPRPKDELPADKLRDVMTKASDAQLAKLVPTDAATLKEYRRVVGGALRAMVALDGSGKVAFRDQPTGMEADGLAVHRGVIGWSGGTDATPAVWVKNLKAAARGEVVWVHPKGQASLFAGGKAVPAVRQLTDAGFTVVAPDVFGVGTVTPEKPRPVDKVYAGFTYGYNRTPLAERVHDVLKLIVSCVMDVNRPDGPVHLVGFGEMGPVAVLAKALSGNTVSKLAADLNQFHFEAITDAADPMMLPGAVKYGGLPAFLALCAPGAVLAHNHAATATGKLSKAAYDAAGAADKLTRVNEKLDDAKVVEWLLK